MPRHFVTMLLAAILLSATVADAQSKQPSTDAHTTNVKVHPLKNGVTLAETLQWLSGASEEESADEEGIGHIDFESNEKEKCAVIITETRRNAGPDFSITESFSLADIDPADIQVEDVGEGEFSVKGEFSVRFHTTNYRKTIIDSSRGPFWPGGPPLKQPDRAKTSDYSFFTNFWFAPRFAKAFRHAVELCGGRPSSF